MDGKKRLKVESKRTYKSRTGKSPDLADSTFGCIFLARERFGLRPAGKAGQHDRTPAAAKDVFSFDALKPASGSQGFRKLVAKYQDAYSGRHLV